MSVKIKKGQVEINKMLIGIDKIKMHGEQSS